MARVQTRRITLRFPEEHARRIEKLLDGLNKGKRAKNRMSVNEWIVGAIDSRLEPQPGLHVGMEEDTDGW